MIEEAGGLVLSGIAPHALRFNFEFDDRAQHVLVNRIQIQQVTVKLIRSAFEAMADQELREVTLATRALDNDMIEVAVADIGPGIPDDISGQLFEPFVSNKHDGMGLGLSISRSIIEAHDGRLTAESKPGVELFFNLPFPLRWPMPTERFVYVPDDDEAVRRSLPRLLSSANFELVTFERSDIFINAAGTFKTGCVLLDIRLPGISGLEVQEQLYKIRSDLPVIIMTAQGDVRTAVRATEGGRNRFPGKAVQRSRNAGIDRGGAFAKEIPSGRDREIAAAVRRVATLSPREHEVLDGLMDGRPNKMIALQLGISARTVEVHRACMMERLGTRQSADALRLGIMSKLNVSPAIVKPQISTETRSSKPGVTSIQIATPSELSATRSSSAPPV
jgi:two-component system, LuxR family, response regulator FixJ